MMKYFEGQNGIPKCRNDWVTELETFFNRKIHKSLFLVRIYSNAFQIGSKIANSKTERKKKIPTVQSKGNGKTNRFVEMEELFFASLNFIWNYWLVGELSVICGLLLSAFKKRHCF